MAKNRQESLSCCARTHSPHGVCPEFSVCRYSKCLTIIAFVLAILFWPSALYCQEEEGWLVQASLHFTDLSFNVGHLPLQIRDVPIHRDDDHVPQRNAGPVGKQEYRLSSLWTTRVMFKRRLADRVLVGMGANWVFNEGDRALRNYTNAVGTEQRGKGAALTFVEVRPAGLISGSGYFSWFNLSPELTLEVEVARRVTIGTSVSYFEIEAANGWDRFNRDEIRDRFTLSRHYPISVYVSFRNWVTVGATLLESQFSRTGAEASLGWEDTIYFVGVGSGWG